MIESYNEKMGGVDLVDIMVACYRYSNSDMLKLYNIYLYLFLLQGPLPDQEVVVCHVLLESQCQCSQRLETQDAGKKTIRPKK